MKRSDTVYILVLISSFLLGCVLLRDRPKTRVVSDPRKGRDSSVYGDQTSDDTPRRRGPLSASLVDHSYGPDEFNFENVLAATAAAGGADSSEGGGGRFYDEWKTWDVPLVPSDQINTWTKYSRVCGSTSKEMACGVAVNCINVAPNPGLIAETIRRATIHRGPRNHMPPWIPVVLYYTKEGRKIALERMENMSISKDLNIRVAPEDWISEEDVSTIGNMGAATSIYISQHALKTFEWLLMLNSSYIPSNQVSRIGPPRPAAEAFPMLTFYDILGRPFPRLEDTFTASSQALILATTFLYLRRSKQTLLVLEQWKRNILHTYKDEASRIDELFLQSLTLSLSVNQLPTPVAASLLDVSLCLYDHTGVDWAAHQEVSGKRVMQSRFAFCDAYLR